MARAAGGFPPAKGGQGGLAERAHAQRGFTLIEVMVVLVIMGVMATGISLGGCMAGAQKEGNDRLDNLLMYHRGEAPLHGVEWLDWLATWTGASVVAYALVRLGVA